MQVTNPTQVQDIPPPPLPRDTKSHGGSGQVPPVGSQGNPPEPLNSTPKTTPDKVSTQIPADPRKAVSQIQQDLWDSKEAQEIRRQMEGSRGPGVETEGIFDKLKGAADGGPWKLENGRLSFTGAGDKISEAYVFINKDGKLDFFIAGENGKSAVKGAGKFKGAAEALLKKAEIDPKSDSAKALGAIKPEAFKYQKNLPVNTCRIIFYDPTNGEENAWIRVNNGGVEFGGAGFGLENSSLHETYANVFKMQPGGVHYNNHPQIFSSVIEYLRPGLGQHTVLQSVSPKDKEDLGLPEEEKANEVQEEIAPEVVELEPEGKELLEDLKALKTIIDGLENINESTNPDELQQKINPAIDLAEEIQRKIALRAQIKTRSPGKSYMSEVLNAFQNLSNKINDLEKALGEKDEVEATNKKVPKQKAVFKKILLKSGTAKQRLLELSQKLADTLQELNKSVQLLESESSTHEVPPEIKVSKEVEAQKSISHADQAWQKFSDSLGLDAQENLKANKAWGDFTEKIPQREKFESLQTFQQYLEALSEQEKNQANQAWREFLDGLPHKAKFAAIKASNIFGKWK